MQTLQIIYKTLDELKEYENNPRHNDSAVDAVAASIKEFGFRVPVIIDEAGVIVAGHTRVKAARSLGMKSVPVVVADDLTPDQVKAFRLADNKTGELAGWDFAKLEEELDGLVLDMSKFGFAEHDDIDIDAFFEDAGTSEKEKEPKRIQCPHCGEWFEA